MDIHRDIIDSYLEYRNNWNRKINGQQQRRLQRY